jgi:ElaA protein
MSMQWHCLPFEQLSATQLYNIMALRQEVFVVEQTCAYLDADGKDPKCYHVWAEENGQTLAYARLVKPGISYPEVSIGRVVTAPTARRMGLGKELMRVCIDCITDLYGEVPIRISAQCYLEVFYQGFLFVTISEPYLEDDIPHVGMMRAAGK